jgi:UDPglucose 6-dehydrogenase
LAVAKEFAKNIKKHSIIITKSTVPVGTAEKVRKVIIDTLKERGEEIEFDVVSNPEFLKEGTALEDFTNPERIVIGRDSDYSEMVMRSIYKKFPDEKLVFTTIPSAEMIKYAANSMLAVRISFMNDIANLCDKVGANVEDVAKGIGLDSRIGPKFLQAGCGYGGSCFPKDVKALIKTGEQNNVVMNVIKAAETTNELQKHILYKKLYTAAAKVNYPIKNIAVLGTAFKADTDDMREATSIVFINDLLNDNKKIGPFDKIKIYDPIALNEAKRRIGDSNEKIEYCKELDKAIINADAIVIVTDWKQIKEISLDVVKRLMNGNIIIDGRNVFDRTIVESLQFTYEAIGK